MCNLLFAATCDSPTSGLLLSNDTGCLLWRGGTTSFHYSLRYLKKLLHSMSAEFNQVRPSNLPRSTRDETRQFLIRFRSISITNLTQQPPTPLNNCHDVLFTQGPQTRSPEQCANPLKCHRFDRSRSSSSNVFQGPSAERSCKQTAIWGNKCAHIVLLFICVPYVGCNYYGQLWSEGRCFFSLKSRWNRYGGQESVWSYGKISG